MRLVYLIILDAHAVMHTHAQTCFVLFTIALMTLLRVVFHLPQSSHDVDWVRLSSNLLELWVIDTHKDIMFLIASDRAEQAKNALTFSSPMVNLPCVSLFACEYSSSRLIASLLRTVFANLTFPLVYSWPGYTLVSSGRAARVSFRALCISLGVPSKNRPQPPINIVSPVNTARSLPSSKKKHMLSWV
jgi:hypothetical protein